VQKLTICELITKGVLWLTVRILMLFFSAGSLQDWHTTLGFWQYQPTHASWEDNRAMVSPGVRNLPLLFTVATSLGSSASGIPLERASGSSTSLVWETVALAYHVGKVILSAKPKMLGRLPGARTCQFWKTCLQATFLYVAFQWAKAKQRILTTWGLLEPDYSRQGISTCGVPLWEADGISQHRDP
jgi:hypothetical protein